MLTTVDAHTHLDSYRAEQLPQVLMEIEQHQCLTFAVAMDVASYKKTCQLAQQSRFIYPCFGIHPWQAHHWAHRLNELDELIQKSWMLGELGLDFHWVTETERYPLQKEVLTYFLQHAEHRPVNLHTKGAETEIVQLLTQYEVQTAVIHWYSGSLEPFRELLEMGAYFTIGVELHQSPLIQQLAREIPLAQLLTETDGPAGLEWLTGEVGMPHHLLGVLDAIATLKGMPVEAVATAVYENGRTLCESFS